LVAKNKDGLNMLVGERGLKLSGGEKQRIGIARALYKDPAILVLDEATSALDQETEAEVLNSIISLKGRHTVIIVAHRLSTVEVCNKIYLISDGKVVDDGDLHKLITKHPNLTKSALI